MHINLHKHSDPSRKCARFNHTGSFSSAVPAKYFIFLLNHFTIFLWILFFLKIDAENNSKLRWAVSIYFICSSRLKIPEKNKNELDKYSNW